MKKGLDKISIVRDVRVSAPHRTRETIGQQCELSNDGGACAVVYLFREIRYRWFGLSTAAWRAGNKWKVDARKLLGSAKSDMWFWQVFICPMIALTRRWIGL